ncbi:MAG: hypothetical protein AAFQ52_10600 [Chloroflexota bacterium]
MNTNLRTFYTIALTQVLSIIGSRISALALSIYVFTETQSATPIALVMFFIIVPQILLSGVGGALADRWNRRMLGKRLGRFYCWRVLSVGHLKFGIYTSL